MAVKLVCASTFYSMLRNLFLLKCIFFFITSSMAADYVNKSHTKPWRVRFYPKQSLFKKSDLIDRGCNVFIRDCPRSYKQNIICARHYDGEYKTFNNYCEMEFENCNSWRKWNMIKRDRC